MKISELIKQLTDNLNDDQKEMDACFLDNSGDIYTVDTIMTIAVSATTELPEGQTVMAAFGIVKEV